MNPVIRFPTESCASITTAIPCPATYGPAGSVVNVNCASAAGFTSTLNPFDAPLSTPALLVTVITSPTAVAATTTLSVRRPATNTPLTAGATVVVVSAMSTVPTKLTTRFPNPSRAVINTLNPTFTICPGMFPPAPASTVNPASTPGPTLK